MHLGGAEKGRVRLVSEPLLAHFVPVDPDGSLRPTAEEPTTTAARFILIPDRIADLCKAGAYAYLRQLQGSAPSAEDVEAEQRRLMVSWGLRRDEPGYRAQIYPFPNEAYNPKTGAWDFEQLKNCAVRESCPNVSELYSAYDAFKASEFPPFISQKQWGELVQLGKELTLQTLVSQGDFYQTLRALPGLAVLYRRSGRGNGTDGRP